MLRGLSIIQSCRKTSHSSSKLCQLESLNCDHDSDSLPHGIKQKIYFFAGWYMFVAAAMGIIWLWSNEKFCLEYDLYLAISTTCILYLILFYTHRDSIVLCVLRTVYYLLLLLLWVRDFTFGETIVKDLYCK